MSSLSVIPSRRRTARVNLALGYSRYGVGIINQLVLVPLYLRYLTLDVYGAWLASGNIIVLLGVLDFGFNLVVAQRLAAAVARGDDDGFSAEVGSTLGISAAATVVVTVLSASLSSYIPHWIHTPTAAIPALREAIIFAGMGAGARVVGLSMWSILQAWQLAFESEFSLLLSSVAAIAAILAGLSHGMGVAAFGLGDLVSGTSALVLMGAFVWRQWRRRKLSSPRIGVANAARLLAESFPVILSRAGTSVFNNGMPSVVSICLNPTAAAILSLTSRVYVACQTLLSPLAGSTFAGMAHLASGASLPRVREVLKELFTIATLAAAPMFGMALALNVGFGHLWVGAERFGGLGLNVAICVASLLFTASNIGGTILTALGDVRGPAWCSLVELAVRLPLTVLLLFLLGIIGAPIAAIVASIIVSAGYLFYLFGRNLQMDWARTVEMLKPGALALMACVATGIGASLVLPPATSWISLIGQGFLMGTILVTCVLTLSRFTRQSLRGAVFVLWSRIVPTRS